MSDKRARKYFENMPYGDDAKSSEVHGKANQQIINNMIEGLVSKYDEAMMVGDKAMAGNYSSAIKKISKDLDNLKILPPDVFPLATEHIDKMIEIIQILINKGHAYPTNDNSVFFSIDSFKDYGKLSNIDMSKVITGSRVSSDEYKLENPSDFVDNATTFRARAAKDEILPLLIAHCNEKSIALATGEAAQIEQAYSLKVIKTAKERDAEAEADLAKKEE